MTAFDTDVLSLILMGDLPTVTRAAGLPRDEQSVPIVAAEEILRGRLNLIRQLASRPNGDIEQAYAFLAADLREMAAYRLLPYTAAAHQLFLGYRAAKIRIGTQDLKIASSCIVAGAKLATRNRRDFQQVPGLMFEVWN